jgi:hypothetical protein
MPARSLTQKAVLLSRHAFSACFPVGPELRKELGEQLIAGGLVGAAMSLFEELELWDALIICYRLLDKNVQAEELVTTRLQVSSPPVLQMRRCAMDGASRSSTGGSCVL